MRFAAIGLDHRPIHELTQGLLDAGARCAGYNPDTSGPRVLAGFRRRFPDVPAAATRQLLDDPSIDFVLIAAVPRDRARRVVAAMQRGKDVMVDKPGVTTADELAAIQSAVLASGRIWSIALGRLASPAQQKARRIVRSGEPGRLVHITSRAPHRLNRTLRPAWFFDALAYGGIINDIGRHSIDPCLALADAEDAEIVHANVATVGTEPSGFEDFAALVLTTPLRARLYPSGLVHARWSANLGRRPRLPGRGRRHTGDAQEPGHRRPFRRRPLLRRQSFGDPLCRPQQDGGYLLSRLHRGCGGAHPARDATTAGLHGVPTCVAGAGTCQPFLGAAFVMSTAITGPGSVLKPEADASPGRNDRAPSVWSAASSQAQPQRAAAPFGVPATARVPVASKADRADAIIGADPPGLRRLIATVLEKGEP